MALETLIGVEEIGGFKIYSDRSNEYVSWTEAKKTSFIVIDNTQNSIAFKIQNGPIKEVGVNGCQVDTVIEAAKLIIEGLNKQFPCRENSMVITKLDEALLWSMKRKLDREKRNVEGINQA